MTLHEVGMSGGTAIRFIDEGRGPCVVLLHGFPDTRATWCALSKQLVGEGYRVLVPALRGYAPSDIPPNRDYSLRRLSDDVCELLGHLGVERASIIGHDWGASAAYAFSALQPQRTSAIVTMAIPPLAVFPTDFREWIARLHNFYLRFGTPSAWWFHAGGEHRIRRFYWSWSPSWNPPETHIANIAEALRPFERVKAAVDYYRRNGGSLSGPEASTATTVPALMIVGSDEPAVRKEAFERALPVVGPGSRIVILDGAGHWPHLEAPERCFEEIAEFLARTVATG